MPKTSVVERKIWETEGFWVIITQNVGGKERNLRGDKLLPKQYKAIKASKNAFTVAQWRAKFRLQFPGYDVKVLYADGSVARGNTKLSTVRGSYIQQAEAGRKVLAKC